MHRLFIIAALFLLTFAVPPLAPAHANENAGEAASRFKVELSPAGDSSQMALNEAAARELKRADDKLNEVYNLVLSKHQDDPEFTAKFVAAELAWLAFRDAELEAIYPKTDKSQYGSIFPMVYCISKAELTWDRVRQLNEWLEGFPEGDPGAGSRQP